jgi:hypothetical protein
MLPESSVLIAVVTSQRDLERACDEHWYRIPERSAPKFFPPDYVAFYLTKAFQTDAFSIRWYAQVRGHELVTRRDLLPDEPDHPRADQRYYKLQLGKLVELPHPIPSRSLRRITFILTNGKRLNEAWEINDLFLGPREHDLLWRALKEARLQAERNYVLREANAVYRVDFAVECRDGTLGVICGELPAMLPRAIRERLLCFTPAQIDASPQKCVEAILAAAVQWGGPDLKPSVLEQQQHGKETDSD